MANDGSGTIWKSTRSVDYVARGQHPVYKVLGIANKTLCHQQIHAYPTEQEFRKTGDKFYQMYRYTNIPEWEFVFPVSRICLIIDSKGELYLWKASIELTLDKVVKNCLIFNLLDKEEILNYQSEGLDKLSYSMFRKADNGKFYERKDGGDELLPYGTSDVIRIAGYASSSDDVKVSLEILRTIEEDIHLKIPFCFDEKMIRVVHHPSPSEENIDKKEPDNPSPSEENIDKKKPDNPSPSEENIDKKEPDNPSPSEENIDKKKPDYPSPRDVKFKLKRTDYKVTFTTREEITNNDKGKTYNEKKYFLKFSEFKYGGPKKCVLCSGSFSSPSHNTVYQVVSLDKYLAEVHANKETRKLKVNEANAKRVKREAIINNKPIKIHSCIHVHASDRVKIEGYINYYNHPNILITYQSKDDDSYHFGFEEDSGNLSNFITAKLPSLLADKFEDPNHAEEKEKFATLMKEKFVRDIVEGFLALHKHKPKRKHKNLTKENVKICENSSVNPNYIAKVEDHSFLCRTATFSEIKSKMMISNPEDEGTVSQIKSELISNPEDEGAVSKESVDGVEYIFHTSEENSFHEELKALGKVCFFVLTGDELELPCSDNDKNRLSKYPEAQDLICEVLVRSNIGTKLEEVKAHPFRFKPRKATNFFKETRHYLGDIRKKDDKKALCKEIEELLTDNLGGEVLLKVIEEPLKVIDELKDLIVSQVTLDAKESLAELEKVLTKLKSNKLSGDVREALTAAIKKLDTVDVASFSDENVNQMEQLKEMKDLTNVKEDLKVIHQFPIVTGTQAVLLKAIKVLNNVNDVSSKVAGTLTKEINELEELNADLLSNKQLDGFQRRVGLFTHYHGLDALWNVINGNLSKVSVDSSKVNSKVVLTKLIKVLSEANKVPLGLEKVLTDKIDKLKKADVRNLSKEVSDQLNKLTKWKDIINDPGINLVTNIRNSVSHTTHTLESVESVRKDYPTILINLYNVMEKKCDDIRINDSYFEWNGKLAELAERQEESAESESSSTDDKDENPLIRKNTPSTSRA